MRRGVWIFKRPVSPSFPSIALSTAKLAHKSHPQSLSHFSQQSKSTGGAPRTTSTSELWPKQSS